MREQAVLFGRTKSLVGVVTDPDSDLRNSYFPAIILLNAGLLHRIGPNRLYVKIARQMASVGFIVLRFDFSGIGDSRAREDDLPFERSTISETQEAMRYLSSIRDIEKFILMGVCSGANVAFKAASCDLRVVGTIGINGSYYDSMTLEGLNQHIKNSIQGRYYCRHLLDYRSWWRVVTGKSNLSNVIRFLINKARDFHSQNVNISFKTDPLTEWNTLAERGVDMLLVNSEGSAALDTFRLLSAKRLGGLEASGKLTIEIVEHTDHVFTLLWSQNTLVDIINKWIRNRNRVWITD
jgi:pimeloyl-ACP methyl ester carboxylesterase